MKDSYYFNLMQDTVLTDYSSIFSMFYQILCNYLLHFRLGNETFVIFVFLGRGSL